jgi:hypothetical protein
MRVGYWGDGVLGHFNAIMGRFACLSRTASLYGLTFGVEYRVYIIPPQTETKSSFQVHMISPFIVNFLIFFSSFSSLTNSHFHQWRSNFREWFWFWVDGISAVYSSRESAAWCQRVASKGLDSLVAISDDLVVTGPFQLFEFRQLETPF